MLCREHLEQHEKEIGDLETGLEKVRKLLHFNIVLLALTVNIKPHEAINL